MLVRSLESNPRPPVSAVKRRKHYLKDVQAEFHVSWTFFQSSLILLSMLCLSGLFFVL